MCSIIEQYLLRELHRNTGNYSFIAPETASNDLVCAHFPSVDRFLPSTSASYWKCIPARPVPTVRHFKSTGNVPVQCQRSISPIQAPASVNMEREIAGFWLPGRRGLVAHGFAPKVLEIIGIHLDRVRRLRFRQRANCPGCRRRRSTRRRGGPEAAVLEDFADHLVLPGLNKGHDLHRAPALGAQ